MDSKQIQPHIVGLRLDMLLSHFDICMHIIVRDNPCKPTPTQWDLALVVMLNRERW